MHARMNRRMQKILDSTIDEGHTNRDFKAQNKGKQKFVYQNIPHPTEVYTKIKQLGQHRQSNYSHALLQNTLW